MLKNINQEKNLLYISVYNKSWKIIMAQGQRLLFIWFQSVNTLIKYTLHKYA